MEISFMLIGRAAWLIFRPESLLVVLYTLPIYFIWKNRLRTALRLQGGAVILTLAIGVLPLGELLLAPLERSYPPEPDIHAAKGIIILGGGEGNGPDISGFKPQLNSAGDRITTAVALAHQLPDAVILYSGANRLSDPNQTSSYDAGPSLLMSLGIPRERIVNENLSKSTAQNATKAYAEIGQKVNDPWILVTSAFHMPRAYATFCAAGWKNVIPVPTDYRTGNFYQNISWNLANNLRELNLAAKEWVGLLAYRASGRITAFAPRTC